MADMLLRAPHQNRCECEGKSYWAVLGRKINDGGAKGERSGNGHAVEIQGASEHNLKNISVSIPLGTFTCVTGVSGSGKSTLISDVFYPAVSNALMRSTKSVGAHKKISGLEHIDKVINIDQGPIGRTPRSNPATYVGVFNGIRDLYASLPEAKMRGYKPGRFSFNVKGGRCENCQGAGTITIEMNFYLTYILIVKYVRENVLIKKP